MLANASEPPPPDDDLELPPLEDDSSEAGIEPDYSSLLEDFDEEETLDDSVADDLDAGIHLKESVDSSDAGDDEQLLEIGLLLPQGLEESSEQVDDTQGPADLDLTLGLVDLSENDADDSEGTNEFLGELINQKLPELDRDDDNDEPLSERAELPPLSGVEDELVVTAAAEWPSQPLAQCPSPCAVLVPHEGTMLVAGGIIARIDSNDRVEVLARPPNSVMSAVVFRNRIVVATVAGEVYEYGLDGSGQRRLTGWREAAGLRPFHVVELSLSATDSYLLLWVSTGVLLATRDDGHTWEKPVVGGNVLALSAGRPPLAVVETPEGTMLMRIDRSEGVQPRNAESLLGTQTRLAVASSFIVAARPGAGVGVSSDGGATFHRLRGGSGVSAVTVGMVEGRATAFMACFRAAECESALLLVEPLSISPVRIASIRLPSPDEDMTEDDARITTLLWDADRGILWAAGGFGVARFRRPES